jgi:cation diffusion facilitator family transporter
MLIVKGSAYLLTNSSAIFSDALESVVHLGAIAMAFYSVLVSTRPPDTSHPYGHGKIEFLSAGIEGTLITLAAVGIILEAVHGFVAGKILYELDAGMMLILGASVVNLLLGRFLVQRGEKTRSITLRADGRHILTDSYTSFGVVAGLILVRLTGIGWLDGAVAIVVALSILVTGYRLVRTSVGGLMDESDIATLRNLVGLMNEKRTAEWISIHNLRVMRSGDHLHVDFHLTVPFYWSVDQGHRFQQRVGQDIAGGIPNNSSVMIHVDPCTHEYCLTCRVEPCRERANSFQRDLAWDMQALTGRPPVFDPDEL